MWNLSTGGEAKKVIRVHTESVLGMAFSPDGHRLATASDDQQIKLLIAATGEEVLTLIGHAGPVYTVTFSRDGQRLASGSWDRTARVWSAVQSSSTDRPASSSSSRVEEPGN
jgi:WD40 repeat protein